MVYKNPIVDNNLTDILLKLVFATGDRDKLSPTQVLFPERVVGGFYLFPLIHPPLDVKSIQTCFCSFALSVLHALKAIHEVGIC